MKFTKLKMQPMLSSIYLEGLISTQPQVISYTSFNKVSEINENNNGKNLFITYGSDKQRIKTVMKIRGELQKTKYFAFGGTYEKIIDNTTGVTKELCYLPGVKGYAAIYETNSNAQPPKLHYIHRDHQGSIQCITNENGNIEEEMSFDAWGNRRNATDWTYNNVPTSFMFDRGYTGHEMLDQFGLINMNGRVYDALTARFLSPDPIVQDPFNSQCYNRYSYCVNNPMMYTDQSGYGWTDADGKPMYDPHGYHSGSYNEHYDEDWNTRGEGKSLDSESAARENAQENKWEQEMKEKSRKAQKERDKQTEAYREGIAKEKQRQKDIMNQRNYVPTGTQKFDTDGGSGCMSMKPEPGKDDPPTKDGWSVIYKNKNSVMYNTPESGLLLYTLQSDGSWYKYPSSGAINQDYTLESIVFAGFTVFKSFVAIAKTIDNASPMSTGKMAENKEVYTATKEGVVLPKGTKIPSGYIENPNRSSSYGIMENGKFVEKLRIDQATSPGIKGPNNSHIHINGGNHSTKWPW